MLLRRGTEEMRPQLGFLDDEGSGSEPLYDTLHQPGEIDWEEEHGGFRHHTPSHCLASKRKGRQDDAEHRELLMEGGQNRLDSLHLTDRSSVEPQTFPRTVRYRTNYRSHTATC
jgi:hypothetical protein